MSYPSRLTLRWTAAFVALVCVQSKSMAQDTALSQPTINRAEMRVGIDEGDLRGSDNRVLQAAVDQVASLGGGTVIIAPGRYLMRNALKLRDGVRIVGTQDSTVLAACDGASSLLSCDGDCNERQVTLKDATSFQIGDGITIRDDNAHGFMVTTATLLSRVDDNTFTISSPLYLDYMVAKKARADLAFPIIGGWNVSNASVEGLTIEGNAAHHANVDGCRAGGIYLFECKDIHIRNCVVRDYNGDGISFQVSENVTVEGCSAENNRGLGLHPGSGSQRPTLRNNRSLNNGSDGLYVCWRVKHGTFEGNILVGNQGSGISIGHKDTDNTFRGNTITENKRSGVFFREESEAMGAHRNVFENNRILDNGRESKDRQVNIEIRGHHNGLVFRRNLIGSSEAAARSATIGVVRGPNANGLQLEENRFLNTGSEVE